MSLRSSKRGGVLLAAVVSGAMVLAGCGSSSSGASSTSAPAPTSQAAPTSAATSDTGAATSEAPAPSSSAPTSDTGAAPAGGAPKGTAPVSAPQGTVPSVIIGVPGIPPVISSTLFHIADQKGFYKAFGVNVTVKDFKTGTDATRALSTGGIQISIIPPAQAIQLAAKGVDTVSVQGQEKPDWVVASSDPSVKSCKDLKGQSLGVDAIGGIRYIALNQMLKTCGLTIKDVKPLVFPGNQNTQAMVAGQLKTSILHLNEVFAIQEKSGKPLTQVMTMATAVPNTMYEMIGVQKEKLQELRPALVRVVAANIATLNWMFNPANADEVAQLLTMTGDTATTMKKALAQYAQIGFWELDNAGLPVQNIENMIKGQIAAGNITQAQAPDAASLIDTSVYADAQKLVQP